MASYVPPGAPRPASNANNPPSSHPPPNFRANPNSLADNLHNLNFNSAATRAPSPLPGTPFPRQATQPRPPSGPPFPPTFSHPNQPSPWIVPPPGARPPPFVSSASGGLASNGQPVFASGALPGGQWFPPLGSAPQPPVRPPPTMAMAMAMARAPPQPQPPTATSRPLMGSSPIRAPPVQPASPFSAAPQARQPHTTGYPYGQPTWPLQPGQGAPPPPITGSPQPPRMFGMPPPPPNQSMTSVSPTVGQIGAPVAGASRIDPNQIPRPIPGSSVILHETRQGNQANPPPPATSDYIVRDTGNCSPRYMRCTINQIPCTDDLLTTSGMQLALMVQPLAIPHPSEETVQVVDFGESGPVRCSRCKGYINPFMKFIDQGRRFICNFCGFTDETPREYHCNLGPDGRRRDADERPELCRGTVEFVASREYMVRDPMPAVYFFLIDVSTNAIQTGATAAACGAINQVIADLPEGPRTMVGIATFDSTIHFYSLKRALQQVNNPLMLVVPDVQDVYTPLQTDVVVQLSECRQHLELLLESIPTMFLENRTAESAFGAATKSCHQLALVPFLQEKLKEELTSLQGRSIVLDFQEAHKLLQPADETLKAMAIEFAEYQVCVDVFITTQTYVDIASIAVIPRTTGGQVYYYYPFSAVSDPAKLYNDLRWNVTRPQGFEAVMRVRCSQGIEVLEYNGNFCKRMPTDVDLPGIDCDKTVMVTLKHDDNLKDGSECAFQCALLYTTVNGQRRIRVTTLSLPCTSILSNLFRSADLDTQFACFLKQAASEIPSRPLLLVRDRMTNLCINILLSYRKFCATVTSSGQLILPEALKLLPLYTLALIKSKGLRTDGRIDERSFWINYLSSISTPLAIPFVHPRMVAIHDLNSKEGDQSLVPPVISLSTEHVNDGGIYLLENGEDCLIYIGNSVDSDILQQLFCISSVDEIPAQFVLQQYDNPLSKKLNDLVNEIRRQRCSYLRLKLCKKGDPSGMLFFSYMIEDKSSSGLSYVEFLVHVHRQIQLKMSS
ncbi:protein transport protein Sec24-like At4g32640 isoform X3 [Quercus robur]|uniref:protein transport protein Sec24-like At4g32640 isoform X3 n=1 Tax=Quercus robur TaxID=38942 RepID=UPI0021639450|nr:protein transport protein Sec24-like At4g32640 isoform X3 [Quercus robur]